MKKIMLLLIFFKTSIVWVQAQPLYGLAPYGGKEGAGAIIKFTPATNDLEIVKSFEIYAAHPYYTSFIEAADGTLYGMTSDGGNGIYDGSQGNGYGVIFSYVPATSTYKMLYAFDGINGRNPFGNLIQGSNGKLYGMTKMGGKTGEGVVFSLDPLTSVYTKLEDFEGAKGSLPTGSLLQASDGKLYGMTTSGGNNGYGVIFCFDPFTSTYTKLKDFNGVDGSSPYGNLMQASDGKLYGMTLTGGISNDGVIFSFDPSSSTYTKLKDFDYNSGYNPYGSLLQASDGKLYGMTSVGGNNDYGVMFSFELTTFTYTKLKDFDYSGAYPSGSLVQTMDGKLYGEGLNSIFCFDPFTSIYTQLKTFSSAEGSQAYGSLLQAKDGKLYGLTRYGGNNNLGVIFSFDPHASTYTKLRSLDENNGGIPSGALLKAGNGKLYGMTTRGGNNGVGVIFSFDPSTFTYSKLIDFDGINGAFPVGNLMEASDGKLYGMTGEGGTENWGVIFSFDPANSVYTKLKDIFGSAANIVNPYGSLMQASNGKLYGLGKDGYGGGGGNTIFSFDLASATFSALTGAYYEINGDHPCDKLIQASNGKLYGMMNSGGSGGGGVIFSFDLSTSTYTKIKDFAYLSNDGNYPLGSLIQASDGKLYGLTSSGGNFNSNNYYGYGVLFSIDPATSSYTKRINFDGTNGSFPHGSLIQASDGKLYGMARDGERDSVGIIFSFDPVSSIYTKLKDFRDNPGESYYHYMNAGLIEVNDVTLPVIRVNFLGRNNGSFNQLNWKVENEASLNNYELQRSIDGQHFIAIAQIAAKGNSSYTYNDPIKTGLSSTWYYRLKNIENDGSFTFSPIVKIDYNKAASIQMNVRPNPAYNTLKISFNIPQPQHVTIRVMDVSGRMMYVVTNAQFEKGQHQLEWNTSGIQPGTYFLHFDAGSNAQTRKILVIK